MFLKAIFAICRKWISGSLCLSGHVRIRKPVIASALLIILSFGLVHAQDSGASASISVTDGKYSCSIRKEPFTSVIDTLFKKGKKEYALISKPNISLENMSYSDKDFDALLSIILLQCNCDYTVNDGVYYIYEIQKKDAVKRLKETRVIHLENISIETLMSLIPNELNASAFIKQDKNGNSIVLTGSPSEISPIEEFVRQIDVKDDKRQHRSIRLKYIKSDELLKNLPLPERLNTTLTRRQRSPRLTAEATP